MKKQKRISRFFSTLLAFALVLSSVAAVPFAVSAESGESSYPFRIADLNADDIPPVYDGWSTSQIVCENIESGAVQLQMGNDVFHGGVRVYDDTPSRFRLRKTIPC